MGRLGLAGVPPGLMRAVEEDTQPLLNSPYQLTSTYTVNLPKVVLFHMSWSCAVDTDGEGEIGSDNLHVPVHMDLDTALKAALPPKELSSGPPMEAGPAPTGGPGP